MSYHVEAPRFGFEELPERILVREDGAYGASKEHGEPIIDHWYVPEHGASQAALCARIDELCAEVERLRRYGAQLFDKTLELGTKNTKLRELVADMWFWSYEGHINSESQETQMEHIDGVLDRMRELGVDE